MKLKTFVEPTRPYARKVSGEMTLFVFLMRRRSGIRASLVVANQAPARARHRGPHLATGLIPETIVGQARVAPQ